VALDAQGPTDQGPAENRSREGEQDEGPCEWSSGNGAGPIGLVGTACCDTACCDTACCDTACCSTACCRSAPRHDRYFAPNARTTGHAGASRRAGSSARGGCCPTCGGSCPACGGSCPACGGSCPARGGSGPVGRASGSSGGAAGSSERFGAPDRFAFAAQARGSDQADRPGRRQEIGGSSRGQRHAQRSLVPLDANRQRP